MSPSITQALILAGGLGTRLQPVLPHTAKSLAPIDTTPFIDLLLSYLKKNGIKEVVLALGYRHQDIREYLDRESHPLKITYSIETEPLGTGGAISHASKLLDSVFFVLNGDTFTPVSYPLLAQFHHRAQADMTLVIKPHQTQTKAGVIKIDPLSQMIVSFQETHEAIENQEVYLNAGVYAVNHSLLKQFPAGPSSLEVDILPQLIHTRSIFGFTINQPFVDIGTPERYQEAQIALSHLL